MSMMLATFDSPEFRVLADDFLPASQLADGLAIFAASVFIALCARVIIPLPFSPVPITGATLGVLYSGVALGSKRGTAAVALYLFEGACGIPVFAGGAMGILPFLGPTGGYLLGFLAGAFVAGRLAERGWDRTPLRAFLAMLAGSVFIFGFGLLGLFRFVPLSSLLIQGLFPFIPGDILKAAISAGLLPLSRELSRRAAR